MRHKGVEHGQRKLRDTGRHVAAGWEYGVSGRACLFLLEISFLSRYVPLYSCCNQALCLTDR